MSKKLVAKRSKVKPFLKLINYNHLMPTRYSLDVPLDKEKITKACFKDPVSTLKLYVALPLTFIRAA